MKIQERLSLEKKKEKKERKDFSEKRNGEPRKGGKYCCNSRKVYIFTLEFSVLKKD